MPLITIQLDSVWRARNQSEGRMVNRASACGLEEVGDHSVIVSLCKRLRNDGHSGAVEVKRDETTCFAPIPIETWANGKALTGEQPEHLRRAS